MAPPRAVSLVLLAVLAFSSAAHAIDPSFAVPQALHLHQKATANKNKNKDINPALLYHPHKLLVPVDHFHNESRYEPHSDEKYPLRYWFDASYYKPGGPVFVLHSGEVEGEARLGFLQKGIAAQIAQGTNGIGVILEHRYYGKSFPVPDLTTENFRFLTTEQALADAAYFAQHITFPGLEDHDLSSNSTPWISYGGSYAGGFSAFLRVQYPDVYWGSISSSGVTKAIWDYWQYLVPIAEKGPPDCIASQQSIVAFVDSILIDQCYTDLPNQLKTVFGFGNTTHIQDFAQTFIWGMYGWQSTNWDPEVSSNDFFEYCDNITSSDILYPETESLRSNLSSLVEQSGIEADSTLLNRTLNMIGRLNLTAISGCAKAGATQDQCFGGNRNATANNQSGIDDAAWKSWYYQYCTEWGYLQTGNAPADQLPLTSRTIDTEYQSLICRSALNITEPADVDRINKYGGYDISYPRLALVDGEGDPWRPAGAHAFEFGAKERESTTSEPFILIADAVHHWDENGLFPNETTADLPPPRIVDVQHQLLQIVQAWLQEWNDCQADGGCSTIIKPEL